MPQLPLKYEYLIAIGSNLGNREEYMRQAIAAVSAAAGPITSTAGIYDTAPIGAANLQFLNSAFTLNANTSPEEMLTVLLTVETNLGRVREVHWGNRTVDLDIIMCRMDSQAIEWDSPKLVIPHPRLLERDFVLCPCAEIAPDWTHPTTTLTLLSEQKHRGYNLKPQRPE